MKRPTASDWQPIIGVSHHEHYHGEVKQEIVDAAKRVARECKSLLTSPADHVEELLSDLQWDEIDDNYFACRSLVGEYLVFSYRKKFSATIEEFAITETAATLDEAKAACWTDYVSRMRAAFKGAK